MDTITSNIDVEGKTWLSNRNNDYYSGDIGFDPLDLKPIDATKFTEIQVKELQLQYGRLNMIGYLCTLCLLLEYIILFITSEYNYMPFLLLSIT